jgi:hypothetical protein
MYIGHDRIWWLCSLETGSAQIAKIKTVEIPLQYLVYDDMIMIVVKV